MSENDGKVMEDECETTLLIENKPRDGRRGPRKQEKKDAISKGMLGRSKKLLDYLEEVHERMNDITTRVDNLTLKVDTFIGIREYDYKMQQQPYMYQPPPIHPHVREHPPPVQSKRTIASKKYLV